MGRPKDEEYWNKVCREEDGTLKCKQCGLKFKGGVSRIKAHVDRIEGKGIRKCDITSSSHSHQHMNVRTAPQGNEGEYDNGVLTTLQSKLDEFLSHLTSEEKHIKEQLQRLESPGKKRKRGVNDRLNQLQKMKQKTSDMKNSLDQFGCSNFSMHQDLIEESQKEIQHLTIEIQKHKEHKPLGLSNEFVGLKFEKNVEMMWMLLQDDQVFIIGIYGMGGVGKTFLTTYMQNEIKRNKTFKDVLWVTVSHDISISKLQQRIGELLNVKLYGEDERRKAMILASELEERKNIVLILDDVWKYIDLEKVGIPLRVNGIKLIMTSRLRHVCKQMNCQPANMIEVNPFRSEDEALKLFLLKLGHSGTPATLPRQMLDIAKSVVKKCDGLPLGINVMARTMKVETKIHWWNHALNKLDKLEIGVEMQEEVLTVLRRSYDNLTEDLQQCFLSCAIPYKFFSRKDLIRRLVDMRQSNGKRTLKEISDEVNVIVDTLINHSLLLEYDSVLGMQDLMKKMAQDILDERNTNKTIQHGENMEKISDVLDLATTSKPDHLGPPSSTFKFFL